MNPDTIVLIAEDDDGHAALIEKKFAPRRNGKAVSPVERRARSLGVSVRVGTESMGQGMAPIPVAARH